MRTPLVALILAAFLTTSVIGPFPQAAADEFRLPVPGVMVHLSPPLDPPILRGIKVHPDNPFQFEFILDKGDGALSNDQLKTESAMLIKYFLASLTIPDKDLWVNLSPYEKDRIIPNSFGLTEMGRDLLGEDYILKQITASLIYPEDGVGKKFWKRIYEEASKRYGTTNIPVNTFNKVWIVPQKAVVFENTQEGTAYVVESKLKVMLEQDYLSLEKHDGIQSGQKQIKDTNQLGSQIVREIVIPELSTEVNENKNFAKLRQVYNSLILAAWYKKKIKDSILEQVYADKNKVVGIGYRNSLPLVGKARDGGDIEAIYQRYLMAFKKGVYNYIKEDVDPVTQETIPRKYFSGGVSLAMLSGDNSKTDLNANSAMRVYDKKTAPSGLMDYFKKIVPTSLLLVMTAIGIGNMNASAKNIEAAKTELKAPAIVREAPKPEVETNQSLLEKAKGNYPANEQTNAVRILGIKALEAAGAQVSTNSSLDEIMTNAVHPFVALLNQYSNRDILVTDTYTVNAGWLAGVLSNRDIKDIPGVTPDMIGHLFDAMYNLSKINKQRISTLMKSLKDKDVSTNPSFFTLFEKEVLVSNVHLPDTDDPRGLLGALQTNSYLTNVFTFSPEPNNKLKISVTNAVTASETEITMDKFIPVATAEPTNWMRDVNAVLVGLAGLALCLMTVNDQKRTNELLGKAESLDKDKLGSYEFQVGEFNDRQAGAVKLIKAIEKHYAFKVPRRKDAVTSLNDLMGNVSFGYKLGRWRILRPDVIRDYLEEDLPYETPKRYQRQVRKVFFQARIFNNTLLSKFPRESYNKAVDRLYDEIHKLNTEDLQPRLRVLLGENLRPWDGVDHYWRDFNQFYTRYEVLLSQAGQLARRAPDDAGREYVEDRLQRSLLESIGNLNRQKVELEKTLVNFNLIKRAVAKTYELAAEVVTGLLFKDVYSLIYPSVSRPVETLESKAEEKEQPKVEQKEQLKVEEKEQPKMEEKEPVKVEKNGKGVQQQEEHRAVEVKQREVEHLIENAPKFDNVADYLEWYKSNSPRLFGWDSTAENQTHMGATATLNLLLKAKDKKVEDKKARTFKFNAGAYDYAVDERNKDVIVEAIDKIWSMPNVNPKTKKRYRTSLARLRDSKLSPRLRNTNDRRKNLSESYKNMVLGYALRLYGDERIRQIEKKGIEQAEIEIVDDVVSEGVGRPINSRFSMQGLIENAGRVQVRSSNGKGRELFGNFGTNDRAMLHQSKPLIDILKSNNPDSHYISGGSFNITDPLRSVDMYKSLMDFIGKRKFPSGTPLRAMVLGPGAEKGISYQAIELEAVLSASTKNPIEIVYVDQNQEVAHSVENLSHFYRVLYQDGKPYSRGVPVNPDENPNFKAVAKTLAPYLTTIEGRRVSANDLLSSRGADESNYRYFNLNAGELRKKIKADVFPGQFQKINYGAYPQVQNDIVLETAALYYGITSSELDTFEKRMNLLYNIVNTTKRGGQGIFVFNTDTLAALFEVNAIPEKNKQIEKVKEELASRGLDVEINTVNGHYLSITNNTPIEKSTASPAMMGVNRPSLVKNKSVLGMNEKGGIDFTANKTPLEIQNAGQGIKFHLNPAMLAQLQNAPGFTPVIINIQPLDSLQKFLGINTTQGLAANNTS